MCDALAKAPLDDVLGAWAGLGYYTRARNLHRAAQIIAKDFDGVFPHTASELRKLPGIGAYTSAAIAAIAYGEPVAALDTKGERVIARFFAVKAPLPKSRKHLRELAQQILPHDRPGDFVQALMDLGSAVCTPKRPACSRCPLSAHCRGFALGIASKLPRKAPRPARPLKRGAAFVALDRQGSVYLEKRPKTACSAQCCSRLWAHGRKAFPSLPLPRSRRLSPANGKSSRASCATVSRISSWRWKSI